MKKKATHMLTFILSLFFQQSIVAQQNDQIQGIKFPPGRGITEKVSALMAREAARQKKKIKPVEFEIEPRMHDRKHNPQNPLSPAIPSFPYSGNNFGGTEPIETSLTAGLSFTGAGRTLDGIGSVPPDNMGAIGPTQYITIVNGKIKTFNKTTGALDGFLNVTDATFWATVRNAAGTSDPRIRYDRKTGRWFVVEINISATLNRIMIAVSSGPNITGAASFTFFQFAAASGFDDYPTLGIDDNALYIGTNNFSSSSGSFVKTNGYVIRKSTLLTGTLNVTSFPGLATGAGAGPWTPQGADNFDNSPTYGYFVGSDNATFGTITMRRVSNAGSASPTISGNISLTVPATTYPLGPQTGVGVPYQGVASGRSLDDLDDRLFAAMIRNDRLWTAHNIQVTSAGIASISGGRDGSRWYEINVNPVTPALVQSGTIFSSAATNPTSYFIPSVMISGQGHAAFGLTSAGLAAFPNTSATGRLSTDAAGSVAAVFNTTASSTSYNLEAANTVQRWGDYSLVTLDPIDDMTMWMINEYCDAANSWGSRVTKLIAPPPATPLSCSPSSVNGGQASVNVVVTGTSVSGSGYYDPGANLPSPALAFNHISATVTGGVVVNSVTYTDPTHITLNLNTTAAAGGNQTFTITNPDGQLISSGAVVITVLVSASTDYYRSVTSGNWNSTSTWESSSSADFSSGVISPATLTPAVSSNTINIRSGHTVTVTANVTTDQTFVNPGGTLVVNGSTLTVSNSGLTIQSDATGTGRIGASTGTISGNATVERFIANAGHRSWHLLSANTTGTETIFNAWQEAGGPFVANKGTLITSNLYNGTNGFDATSNSSSILTHNQGGLSGPSWNYGLANTNTTILSSNPGYMLFVRGDRSYTTTLPSPVATNATVLKSTGALKQGTQGAVNISATGTGRTLVGNPYASAIDMDAIFTGTTNLNQDMMIWDPTLTGSQGVGGFRLVERNGGAYQQTPVVLGGGAVPDAASRYIHSGQAFFLKASGAGANVVFTEASKTASVSVVNPVVATPGGQQLFANLLIADPAGNAPSLADGLRVRFDAAYHATDEDDVEKMSNFAENISSYRAGKKWIVEKRPMINVSDTIFMRMTNTAVKDYRFEIGTFDFVQSNVTAYLEDTYLKTFTRLDLTGAINYKDFTITSDPASGNPDRFKIIFTVLKPSPAGITSIKAAEQGNAVMVTWKISSELAIQKYEVEKSTDGVNFTKMNSQPATANNGSAVTYNWLDMVPVQGDNFYLVKSTAITGEEQVSELVKIRMEKANSSVTVIPNPVINRTISVQFSNMEKGIYQVRLLNTMGQRVFTSTISHPGGNALQTINPGNGIAKGNYQLLFIKPDGTKIPTSILIIE